MSAVAEEPGFRPGVAFAGIFAVTFSGLVAVGAVLPSCPATSTARSTAATSRSGSWSAATR